MLLQIVQGLRWRRRSPFRSVEFQTLLPLLESANDNRAFESRCGGKNSFGVACVNDESVPPGAVKPLASAFLANVFHFPVTPFVFDFAAVLPRHAFHRCDWFVANVSAGNGAELFEEPGSVLDTERGGDALLLAGGEVGAASESSGELRFGHAGGGDFVILTASGLDFPA
jgi:hypothetical protein